MRRLWLALLVALLCIPAIAGPPRVRKVRKPVDREALVRAGRIGGYFDPSDLSKAPVLSGASAVLMDFDTGEILWERNGSVRRYPASTTKILTALVMTEHTRPDETITVTDPKIGQVGESSLHLKPGEAFPADLFLKAFLLRSANDGGVVIAQHVSGSVAAFADLMNQKAQELGATDSHFVNPHGLHDPKHYTTAHDLALIARAALQNPRFADAVRIPVCELPRTQSKDTHIVAKSKKLFYDKFPGADGVKTGYTRPAGHCFVGSATRDGRRLVAVVMDAKVSACSDTIPLLQWGFQRFGRQPVTVMGQRIGTLSLTGGARPDVPLIAGKSLSVPTDRVAGMRPFRTTVQALTHRAPVQEGQHVADRIVWIGDREVARAPLLAGRSVAAAPIQAAVGLAWPWVLGAGGVCGLSLVAWRYGNLPFARSSAKGARRRRRRVPSNRGGVDRRRAG